ncbi:MAG: alpha/beta fold hydrolase [Solirubrobacteraceae bacterium]
MSRLFALVGALVVATTVACSSAPDNDDSPRTAADLDSPGIRFSDRVASVNGVRLHYVIGGSGPAVVLLAGFPETWYAWRKVMPALARRHTVIAVEPPGIGESSIPQAGRDARSTAADISALARRLGLGRVSIAGHDLGGWVAYAFARFHPEQASRLVLLEAGLPGFGLERRAPPTARPSETPRELVARLLARDSAGPQTFDRGAAEDYARSYSRPGRLEVAFDQYRAFDRNAADNRAAGAPKLALPVLFLGAARGGRLTHLAEVRAAGSDVRAELVDGAGHWLMEERPAYVAGRLLDFLG